MRVVCVRSWTKISFTPPTAGQLAAGGIEDAADLRAAGEGARQQHGVEAADARRRQRRDGEIGGCRAAVGLTPQRLKT
eukprot:6161809-Prymnesium_polylepis.1